MPWDDLLGHSEQLERLRGSVARGRLAHTYAFVGPAGVGKRRFAVEVAKSLLCERHSEEELLSCGVCSSCQQVSARTHPDFYLLGLPEGKNELPIELFVGSPENRGKTGLCYELSLRPMSGRRKVACIDDADSFNEASGNALLKTLEEPPQKSLIILLASSADLLLPTIRSRCQILTFQPLADEHVQTLLVREELAANDAEAAEITRLCDGSLETARQLLDPQLRAQRKVLFDMLAAEPFLSAQLAAKMLEGIDSAGSERSSQRSAAGWMIRFGIEFFRRALVARAKASSTAETEIPQVAQFLSRFGNGSLNDLDRLTELLERFLTADRQLESNVAIPLCIETLFDDVGRMLRS